MKKSIDEKKDDGPRQSHGDAEKAEPTPEGALGSEAEVTEKVKKKRTRRQELEADLAAAAQEAAALKDNLLRLQAEFENYKKRQVKEREESRKSANERLLTVLLPVLDNLERALEHGGEGGSPEKMLEGIQLVLKQFRESLSQFGVEPIEAEGAPFDPHVHDAMSRVETDGDPPDGTVVEVYQRGYLLNGRILRAAMVGVAKLVDEGEEGRGQ
jgi:molecular chaperone GrpE